MAVTEQTAPIITAVGGIIATLTAAYITIKTSRHNSGDSSKAAESKAVAVTNFERTSTRVDTLWETIKDLIEEVGQLKEDKAMQQQQINELTRQLAEEKGNHERTRRELEELKQIHADTLKQIAEKDKLIADLMRKDYGKATIRKTNTQKQGSYQQGNSTKG